MLSLRGLLCVISGLLAWGSPGFRTVLCCFFSHKSCMGSLFCCGSLFPCCLVALAIPILLMQSHFLLQCAIWPPVACNVSLVLVFVCCFLFVLFLVCSVVFLVWSLFLFHCMTTASRTVCWSFISTTFAAHHQQNGVIICLN